ncbi:MAG: glycosyltransferase, partial [Coriobacteriia bacterium]|nr:glycosyltransferase [Coriobacteriia bacterium]
MRDNYESYNPLISIIIPLYNRKDTIERAIESLVSQSYQNWELIIVDDCSIDESISKVEAYSDSRIRLLKRSSNAGYLSARNAGLSVMRGEWFGFLDSDDALTSDALERVVH